MQVNHRITWAILLILFVCLCNYFSMLLLTLGQQAQCFHWSGSAARWRSKLIMENTSAPRRTASCWQSVTPQVTLTYVVLLFSPFLDVHILHLFCLLFHQVRMICWVSNWSTDPCWFWEGSMDSSATTGTPTHWMPTDPFMTSLLCSSVMAPTTLKVSLYAFWSKIESFRPQSDLPYNLRPHMFHSCVTV